MLLAVVQVVQLPQGRDIGCKITHWTLLHTSHGMQDCTDLILLIKPCFKYFKL